MQSEHMKGDSIKVFILDDDATYRFAIERLFNYAHKNTDLISFDRGMDCLIALQKGLSNNNLPDFLLIDLNMPEMDGYAFLDELESNFDPRFEKIKFYVVSSSINPDDKHRSTSYKSVQDYIEKPVTVSQIRELLEENQIRIAS